MKNAQPSKAELSASEQRDSTTAPKAPQDIFLGTDNQRHLRGLHELLRRPITREQLDRVAGCSNSPELVAELRRRGLKVPCVRVPVIDRDGREVKRGVYHLTTNDRRKLHRWLARRRVQ